MTRHESSNLKKKENSGNIFRPIEEWSTRKDLSTISKILRLDGEFNKTQYKQQAV